MASWLKKCSNLGKAANGYMLELQVITDEVCQWLDKFEEEAMAYISSSSSEISRELLPPKTPVRQKRLRKRLLKANNNNEDAENSPPSCKSPRLPSNLTLSPESAMKKLSICLTRIDESDSNNIKSQKKTQTPVKPPRRLKMTFELTRGTHSTPKLFIADISKSQTVALKERINNTPNIKKTTSSPASLSKAAQQSNRGSLLLPQLHLKRLSVSRRRSSISRLMARQSIRRSKRLSQKVQRAAITIDEINANNDASFIAEETVESTEDRTKANAQDLWVKVDAVACIDDNSVQTSVVKKKGASLEHCGSNITTIIPVINNIKEISRDCLNTMQTIVKDKVTDSFIKGSIDNDPPHHDSESDVDSVISKTPSPVCPAYKVVRPKMAHKLQSSVIHTALRTPVIKNTLRSKPSISGYHTKTKARNSSLTSNSSYNVSRLSPKPMTPQQKQEKYLEKIYLREQKSQEILRQRNESMKKAIEEKKRKRAEKLMKAKMQKEKIEEARLTKIREEEERMMQRKKMQEEAEKRRIALEKQAEKEQELKRQMEQRQKEIDEREQLRKEAEQKRIAQEKDEKMPNMLNTTVTIEKPTQNMSILDNTCNESSNYNMTPQPVYPKPNLNADNYDIDNLKDGDSTDDDEQPRQVIPRWAQGHAFKKAMLQQLRANINYEDIFPPEELMLVPNLTEIFHARKKKFDKRTSSAVWSSPVWKIA